MANRGNDLNNPRHRASRPFGVYIEDFSVKTRKKHAKQGIFSRKFVIKSYLRIAKKKVTICIYRVRS
jgi:hypothetical protein